MPVGGGVSAKSAEVKRTQVETSKDLTGWGGRRKRELTDVAREEVACRPVAVEEDRPPGEEDDNDTADGRKPSYVRLRDTREVEFTAVDTLHLASLVKANEGERERSPGDESGDGREVEEPLERLSSSTRAEGEIGEEGEEGSESDGVDGHSSLVDAGEDLGSLTVEGHSKEGPVR